ncbi:MAG: hypothetical protein HZA17_03655 [Nitrospirae bacterium]|nr:hypothetical protein [Nitrospirota bacterium]
MTFDNLSPSLSIIEPPQDIKTNIPDITIIGETTDLTAVTAEVLMDGNVYEPLAMKTELIMI